MAANPEEVRRAALAELARRELERRQQSGSVQQPPSDPLNDYRSPFSSGVSQGLTFGFGDELGAGIRAAVKAPFSPLNFREIYGQEVGKIRGELARDREEAPIRSFAGEAVGSLLPTARFAQGAMTVGKNVPNWLKLAGMGGAEGALYGAGTAEGEGKLGGAVMGGAAGAVVAPAVGAVAKPVLTAGRNLAQGAFRGLTNTPTRQAERLVADALGSDLVDPATAGRLQRQGTMLLADAGENLTGLARGSAAKPGPFRALAHQVLPARQQGQQGRLISSLGVKGAREFADSFDDWAGSRITQARPLYEQAYASPLDLSSPKIQALMERPAMQRALRKAETTLKNEGGQRGQVALMDAAKRVLDDDIGVAIRQGQNNQARILQSIKRELVEEMDRQVPVYAQARAVFSGESALRDAADFGSDLFKRNISHDQARRLVADMTPSELDAFRRGALRGLVEQLEKTAENRNTAAKLTESVAVREKLALLFPDGGDFERFVQQAADESRMSYTKNLVLGGSPTARIQEETANLTDAARMITEVTSGDSLGLMARIARGLGYGEVPDEVLAELGELLLKPQSPERIARLTQMANRQPPPSVTPMTRAVAAGTAAAGTGAVAGHTSEDTRRRRLVEALMRGSE